MHVTSSDAHDRDRRVTSIMHCVMTAAVQAHTCTAAAPVSELRDLPHVHHTHIHTCATSMLHVMARWASCACFCTHDMFTADADRRQQYPTSSASPLLLFILPPPPHTHTMSYKFFLSTLLLTLYICWMTPLLYMYWSYRHQQYIRARAPVYVMVRGEGSTPCDDARMHA